MSEEMNDSGKLKMGGKVHVPYKGVLVAGFYGGMSVSSVFINKAIFKGMCRSLHRMDCHCLHFLANC